MPPRSKEVFNTELRIIDLEKDIKKLTKSNLEVMKLATKAVRENGLLKIEIQRLITRVNTNENTIGQFRSKR